MIRPDLSSIPAYVPGENLDHAIKISSNEMATPPLPSVAAAMSTAAAGAHRYPDMGVHALRRRLAAHLGVPVGQVTTGCGSSALCQQLVQITSGPGDEVIFPWRSFEAYPIFAQVVGAKPVMVPGDETGRHDLDAMIAAITERTTLIFLCNPNNPTGATLTQAEFDSFMQRVPAHITVALDEAYYEFNRAADTPEGTLEIRRWPNLVALRTFSKAYGLAGARVGYAFGPADYIEALDKVGIPFSVSTVAQTAAIASLDAGEELLARTEEIVEQRERLATEIGSLPSQGNFLWLPTPEGDPDYPTRVSEALASRRILVRAFPDGVRLTVTTKDEVDQVIAAWRELGLGGVNHLDGADSNDA
ncbi:histidinol-phosphate transaminase [Corynebacterium sp. zg-331]|uniref:histidinol-phosphate transaminase n=1 Tax=unclassified Corynebacterium TaxID=2624378 RepID=UPI00128C71B5|nr:MULTISPECIES: histidinol-phosphate transaminase [unclassified Corynebacterium]MBC3186622.1 histidinol-phosphate transaminase [Corynebacterium sp. zg-331]MPV53106.1 aminotransferase class I/II-fold pyridoxal phosphate-dependent enzyme [Corynebacterium sp. zg331]